MLGISVYLGEEKIADQAVRIRKMYDNGFRSIFTSLHIPEDDHSVYRDQLISLGQLAKHLGMELMADISPASLKSLGYNWENAGELLNWGLTGLRIDYGVDEKTIVQLSQQMRVALNASTIDIDALHRMKEQGLKLEAVEAWHNFYPRRETGLGWNDFIKRNAWLKQAGLTVMAFIPGDEKLRGPLFEKLPTVERHRNYSPFAGFMEFQHEGNVDKILIGDISIGDQSLKQFKAYQQQTVLLRCRVHAEADRYIVNELPELHTNRADHARDVIRSVESRSYATIGKGQITPRYCAERPKGTITIDNERYLRYQGEVQITKTNLPADERVNVLGKVIDEDLALLPFIQANQKFKLLWVEE